MQSKRLHPTIEIEPATPSDILNGLETLEGRSGEGVLIKPPGDGPDSFLNWALQEVNNARQFASEEQKHHCVDAVLNARRALACLVDWYLQRDLAMLCKDAPKIPKQQVKFLIMRGVIDELTSRVLERAIQKRNTAEHQYISPMLAAAEDMVELLRRTISAIRTQSCPEHGPWIFGTFLHGFFWGNNVCRAEFHGWCDPIVVFSRFAPQPWVGLVLPKNKTEAVIRRTLLENTTTDELVELLLLAGRKFGAPSSYTDVQFCELLASEARLL
jgi:hypothetical protein